ncbi:MAG: tetratricopeptide repeat protein [Chloroflexi bacterium]|nr:tetratricopeptide repeat protein [Chloroflexota bacterium]
MRRFIAVAFLIPCLVIIATTSLALAQSPSDVRLMSVANQLYESGQYDQATEFYDQLIREGTHSAALYFNLGNAHYNQGEMGQAILNYRRAQRITPRDEALQSNLDLARSLARDSGASDGETPLALWNDITEQRLTLDELALVTLALWFAFAMALVVVVMMTRKGVKRAAKIVAILICIPMVAAFFALGSRLYADALNPDVVVVADEVEVTTGPSPQYALQLTLRSGAEARQLDSRGSWTKLSLRGGELEGWVPSGSVELVRASDKTVLPSPRLLLSR